MRLEIKPFSYNFAHSFKALQDKFLIDLNEKI